MGLHQRRRKYIGTFDKVSKIFGSPHRLCQLFCVVWRVRSSQGVYLFLQQL